MKHSILLFLIFSFSGCAATEYQYVNTNPDWNPKEGLEWAKAKCEADSKLAGSYGILSLISTGEIEQQEAYMSCMKSFGYDANVVYVDKKSARSEKK